MSEAAEPAHGFTLITGLSGAGRSEVARSLEDLGFFVVDNLPPALLPKMAELTMRPGSPTRVAIVVDARGGVFFSELSAALHELRALERDAKIVFLEASDEDLVRRYEATRRRHPLAPADRVVEGIRKERQILAQLRGDADLIIDTSGLTPHELRDRVRDAFAGGPPEAGLQVSVVSFGFKYGSPRDADLVFDVRCLPNPHYEEALAPLTGRDQPVIEFLERAPEVERMYSDIYHFVGSWLPDYARDNRNYLTVAVGCTGGRHRSVFLVERLAEAFGSRYQVLVRHREL